MNNTLFLGWPCVNFCLEMVYAEIAYSKCTQWKDDVDMNIENWMNTGFIVEGLDKSHFIIARNVEL